jgi:3-oxoacyl-[acyl-carrier-protein] synthase II
MSNPIVITGIGMVTPLGSDPIEVLRRIQDGERAPETPAPFNAEAFDCPVCAQVADFQAQSFASEVKTVRLMNRDAQLAIAAARMALRNANLGVGGDYSSEEIGIFGATGLAGLPVKEIAPLIRASSGEDRRFDLNRFGEAGLKAVSPILSFKILGNMPICFVAINEGIKGPNAIFTPWEGQGAQAIECGVRALKNGQARCALVGGCDVKTHELSFLSLQQQGVFDSWRESGRGVVPAEGAVFLVLELAEAARARGARIYAQLSRFGLSTHFRDTSRVLAYRGALERAKARGVDFPTIVCSADGAPAKRQEEESALRELQITSQRSLAPKTQVGDLFAAAALLQVGLAALAVRESGGRVLATCFGHGSEQAAFVLEEL